MHHQRIRLLAAVGLSLLPLGCQSNRPEADPDAGLDPTPTVVLETTKGRIVMELETGVLHATEAAADAAAR